MRGRNSSIVTSETEPVPDGTQFEANCASADNDQFLGGSANSSASVLLTIVVPSNFANGKFHRYTTRGYDDVFGFDLLRLAAGRFDRNLSRRADCAEAFDHRHLVRLHQRAHTAIECLYNLVLAFLHLCEIGACSVDHDAVLSASFLTNMR